MIEDPCLFLPLGVNPVWLWAAPSGSRLSGGACGSSGEPLAGDARHSDCVPSRRNRAA